MLYEIYFINYYYLLFKENNLSLMAQIRQTPTACVCALLHVIVCGTSKGWE